MPSPRESHGLMHENPDPNEQFTSRLVNSAVSLSFIDLGVDPGIVSNPILTCSVVAKTSPLSFNHSGPLRESYFPGTMGGEADAYPVAMGA